ncbi:MAG: chemotaxis protein CheW [Desulforhopalus sp.]|nr:chemotaxis protein CheW [Desulforhopalus sp.]
MPSLPDLKILIEGIDTQLAEVMLGTVSLKEMAAPDQEKMRKYVLVSIGALHLAIAIDDLSEVGPLPNVTFLPNLPSWIHGIVNVRSEIISVVDFAGFLKLKDQGPCEGSRFVVLQYRKQKIGVRLDRIVGTVSRSAADNKPIDASEKDLLATSLFADGLLVEDTLYYILNVRRFLTAPSLIDYNRVG